MDVFVLLLLIGYALASLPLSLGIAGAFMYRRWGRLSGIIIGTLLAASAVSLAGLFKWPVLEIPCGALLLSGSVVCSAVGLGAWLGRLSPVPVVLTIVVIGATELAFWAWVDFRFRIVIADKNGAPVEVADGWISLRHPPEGIFQSYCQADGIRLGKGTIYFGFLRWLQWKDRWTFSGHFCDPNGHRLGDLGWKLATWSEWPKYVTAE
ncbi:MAG: hypothetical protein J0M04_12070 [Verrucomicrobia bacterium]|nr:hypothetical protein [Verrucomicrobiota bacterium]